MVTGADGRLHWTPLRAVGRSRGELWELTPENAIPLPAGSTLLSLPGRQPLGLDRRGRVAVAEGTAVSAILPTGFLRTLLPAYEQGRRAAALPLYGYTAVAASEPPGPGQEPQLWAAAMPVEEPGLWDPKHFNGPDLPRVVSQRLEEFPGNRLVKHLSRCALEYGCFTAQNLFYRRWEAGIPISAACNARCRGCLSAQPDGVFPAAQDRLAFRPTLDEVVEVGLAHLQAAPKAMVSFGQGCEGEPSMQAELAEAAIRQWRRATSRGLINMNTNGSRPEAIRRLAAAGLGSVRVSLFSARPAVFSAYYRPHGYTLDSVLQSLRAAKSEGARTSLNLLVYPGLTDTPEELAALQDFLEAAPVDLIQLRPLNMDPALLEEILLGGGSTGEAPGSAADRGQERPGFGAPMGLPEWWRRLRQAFPRVGWGSFTPPE